MTQATMRAHLDALTASRLGAVEVNREAGAMAEALAPEAPWATDEPPPDLAAMHAAVAWTGRYRERRETGRRIGHLDGYAPGIGSWPGLARFARARRAALDAVASAR